MNALGEIRPSQFIFSFGVGALLDLPQLSVMILGLQNWDVRYSREISEDRLLAALQRRLGRQVTRLLHPPIPPDDQEHNPAASPIGVPVVPFPAVAALSEMSGYGHHRIGAVRTHPGALPSRSHPLRPYQLYQGQQTAHRPADALSAGLSGGASDRFSLDRVCPRRPADLQARPDSRCTNSAPPAMCWTS